MSPSWMRFFEIFLNNSRMRPVFRKSRWRSSTKIRKIRPAASLVGRLCGRMIPSCAGGGGSACMLNARPPWIRTSDETSCLMPSSRTSKSPLFRSATNCPRESRTITSVVTRSTATRNEGCDAEGGVGGGGRLSGGRLGGLGRYRLRMRYGRQQKRERPGHEELAGCWHAHKYTQR